MAGRSMTMDMKVTAKIADLISHLKKHRAQHQEDYQSAIEIYWEEVRKKLVELTSAASAEKVPVGGFRVKLDKPEDMTAKYDEYIEMLEMAQETEMVIDKYKFDCFVKDDWDWAANNKQVLGLYNSRMF